MEIVDGAARPRLAPHVRMVFDAAREQYTLLSPESILIINATGASIVKLCDAQRTVADIQSELSSQYDQVADDEVQLFIADLVTKRGMEVDHG